MYINSEASTQRKSNQENSNNEQTGKRVIQSIVKLGDQRDCPECRSVGSVVWISPDKKTMGIQCHKSHREASRPASKYGATIVPSTKTRKNIVFFIASA